MMPLPGTKDWASYLERLSRDLGRPLTKAETARIKRLAFRQHEKAKARRVRMAGHRIAPPR